MAYDEGDDRWVDWVNSLPADLIKLHDREQAVSIAAFKAGIAVERARVRGELEAEENGPGLDWSDVDQVDAMIDRVCPRKAG